MAVCGFKRLFQVNIAVFLSVVDSQILRKICLFTSQSCFLVNELSTFRLGAVTVLTLNQQSNCFPSVGPFIDLPQRTVGSILNDLPQYR